MKHVQKGFINSYFLHSLLRKKGRKEGREGGREEGRKVETEGGQAVVAQPCGDRWLATFGGRDDGEIDRKHSDPSWLTNHISSASHITRLQAVSCSLVCSHGDRILCLPVHLSLNVISQKPQVQHSANQVGNTNRDRIGEEMSKSLSLAYAFVYFIHVNRPCRWTDLTTTPVWCVHLQKSNRL